MIADICGLMLQCMRIDKLLLFIYKYEDGMYMELMVGRSVVYICSVVGLYLHLILVYT